MKYLVAYIDKEEEILKKIIAHEGFPLEYEQCKINPKAFVLTTWIKDYDAKPFFDIWWGEILKPSSLFTMSNVVVKCRGGGESHQGRWLGVEVSPESKLEILMTNLPEIPAIKKIMATSWSEEQKALFKRAGWYKDLSD